jgi:hypothetical protein
MTFLEATAAVLRAAKRPLTVREITKLVLERGLTRRRFGGRRVPKSKAIALCLAFMAVAP